MNLRPARVRPVNGSTFAAVRSWSAGIVTVAVAASFGLAACGSLSTGELTSGTEAVATDFKTMPPPTTTLPPTTTIPPEPGSILASEATYVVVEGDYPFVVADRFGIDFDELIALNGWTVENGEVPEWPEPGTTIRIPAGATVPEGPPVLVPVPTTSPGPDASTAPGTSDSATGTSTAVNDGAGCGTYTVKDGDYPTQVAEQLNTTVDKLNAANEGTDGYSSFYVGLEINVPC